MFKARVLSSARARFVATAATVLALVALGGVTAVPAYADGTVTLYVEDYFTGALVPNEPVSLSPDGGGAPINATADPAGVVTIAGLAAGDYLFNSESGSYLRTDSPVAVVDGSNVFTVYVDRFKVDGYVPTGMGSSNTTAVIQKDNGAGGWTADTITQTVTAADDTFLLRVPSGAGTYRIQFVPSEASDYLTTYSPAFVVDGTTEITPLGLVPFDAAGTISGNVVAYNPGGGLAGAVAHAQVGGVDVGVATTDVNGDFRIKVPQSDASYTVWVDHANYEVQYYHYATQESYAIPVAINSGNGFTATGIDYLLNLDTSDLHVNVVDANGAYAVDFTLYLYDTYSSSWSSFPYYVSSSPSASFDYGNLPEGQYRLVVQHPRTGVILPASGLCYTDFTSTLVTNVTFTDLLVDSTSTAVNCDDPAFLDSNDPSVTGTVDNIDDLDYPVIAQLWSSGPYGELYPVDSSPVASDTGEYELKGLRDNWYFFIKFITDDRDPYLDTILGSDGAVWASDPSVDQDVISNHPLPLNPADPSTLDDQDVTLTGGAVLSGTVLDGTTPIVGDVQAIDADDNSIRYVHELDADGGYVFKLPIGRDYLLYAETDDDKYIAEYWDDTEYLSDAEEISASAPGAYGPFDFDLELSPASLWVWTDDPVVPDEVNVHLYFNNGGVWEELETQQTMWEEAYFTQNFDTGYYDGLLPGDYRVRFESQSGVWLEATDYSYGQDAADGDYTEVTTPSCFVDFTNLTDGYASFIDADFDVTAQDPAACGPEPLPESDVTGWFEGSSAYPLEQVANHEVDLYTAGGDYYATTDPSGDFEIDDVTNGTYSIDLYPTSHTFGTHDYTYYGPDVVLTGGDIDLGPLQATRYGNAYGQISNWDDATMSGATATVMHLVTDPGGNYWAPGPVDVEISASGEFEAPGIDVNGSYGVLIQFPDTWAPVFIGGGLLAPDVPRSGTAEVDLDFGLSAVDLDELVPITGTVFFGSAPAEGTWMIATPIGSCGCTQFETFVDENGDYTLDVAPGVSYEVIAFSAITQVQVYDGLNYPIDYTGTYTPTPVVVGTTGATGINFSLVPNDDITFIIVPDAWDEATDSYSLINGVEVHLYQKVGGGWVEVGSEVANLGSILRGPSDGEYRVRFSKNGDWLAVHDAQVSVNYPFEDQVDSSEEFDPAQCYYDFDTQQHGSYVQAITGLIEDSSSYDCGPELAVHDVIGSTVQTANAGGGVIAGQTVTLSSTTSSTVYTTTTDASGAFVFENTPIGDYTLETVSTPATNGRTYVNYSLPVTVDDAEDLGAIELTRYGNVGLSVDNWDNSMTGAVAQLQLETAGTWAPVGIPAVADSNGNFTLSGIAVSGNYRFVVDYPTGYVDGVAADYYAMESTLAIYGDAELDFTPQQQTVAFTTASGNVRLGTTAVQGASVEANFGSGDSFYATTAANGSFTVAVPAGYTYSFEATKTGLLRGLVTGEDVLYAPVTGIPIDMLYAAFEFDVYGGTLGAPTIATTVTAHLYRQVSGGWQEVATDATAPANFWTTLSGSYRVRFSDGADWLAVSAYAWQNYSDSTDFTGMQLPDPNVCFIDIAPARGGGNYWGFAQTEPGSSVDCGAEPAVVAPPAAPGTSGSGTKKPVAAAQATEVELAPTSTPTPTPTASEDAADTPDDVTIDDCCAPASTPDLTWAFWVAGVLVLLVLAGGAVYFVRRRP